MPSLVKNIPGAYYHIFYSTECKTAKQYIIGNPMRKNHILVLLGVLETFFTAGLLLFSQLRNGGEKSSGYAPARTPSGTPIPVVVASVNLSWKHFYCRPWYRWLSFRRSAPRLRLPAFVFAPDSTAVDLNRNPLNTPFLSPAERNVVACNGYGRRSSWQSIFKSID